MSVKESSGPLKAPLKSPQKADKQHFIRPLFPSMSRLCSPSIVLMLLFRRQLQKDTTQRDYTSESLCLSVSPLACQQHAGCIPNYPLYSALLSARALWALLKSSALNREQCAIWYIHTDMELLACYFKILEPSLAGSLTLACLSDRQKILILYFSFLLQR